MKNVYRALNIIQVVAVTDYAEGELFQILEDDHQLPEDQVFLFIKMGFENFNKFIYYYY